MEFKLLKICHNYRPHNPAMKERLEKAQRLESNCMSMSMFMYNPSMLPKNAAKKFPEVFI